MKERNRTYIPALPGFNTLELVRCYDSNGYEVLQKPVIAWEIRREFESPDYQHEDHTPFLDVFPVTQEGREAYSPVVSPDGMVRIVHKEVTYDSIEHWKRRAIEEEEAQP